MALHLGSVPASSTLYIPFETVDGTGLGVTITGLAVTDIEIYKNGSTTQRSSDNGYALLDTDGIDFDGVTGLHGISVDLSDNSDAGFYVAGAQYWVLINAITLAGVSITPLVSTFRIVAAEAVAGKPKVDVDAFGGSAGTFSGGRPEVNTSHWAGTATTLTSGLPDVNMKTITAGIIAAASFAANALDAVWSTATRVLTAGTNIPTLDAAATRAAVGLASANLDTQLATLATAASLATVAGYVDTEVAAIKAKTDQITFTIANQVDVNVLDWKSATAPAMTGDAFARLGAPAGASVSVDVAAIKAVLPGALVSGRIDASVGAMAASVLTATAIAADAITDAKVASDVTIASVTGAVGSVTGAVGSVTGNVGGNVTGSVGSVAAGGITSGSFAAGAIDNTAIAADAIGSSELAASAVTEIQSGLAASSALATLQTSVDDLPTNAELATALAGADDAVLAQVALVKAKTDNLPSDPADASDIASATGAIFSALGVVDGKVDSIKGTTDSLVMTGGKLWVLNDNGDPLPTADDIKASVWTALVGDYLGAGTTAETIYDTLTAAQAANTVTTKLDATLEDSSGYRFTAHALEQAPTGGSAPTASEVAIAVWDEALAGHATDGTAGKVLTDAGAAAGTIEGRIGTPAFGDLAGDIAHAQGGIDGIDAKTTNLPTDPADQSLIIAATDAVMSRLGAPAGPSLSADVAAVKSDSTAVKGKTDSLAFTGGAVDANIAAVNGTEVSGTGALGNEWGPA